MLKKIRNFFSIIFIIFSMIIGFWVYIDNPESAALNLFGFVLDSRPIGFWIVVTFSLGIVLGLFCNIVTTSWMAFKIKHMKKQMINLEKKL